jgi:hypothetical protein
MEFAEFVPIADDGWTLQAGVLQVDCKQQDYSPTATEA